MLLNIQSTCENLSVLEREADKVAYEFMQRKFARWATKNIGKRFKARIVQNDTICRAKLDDEISGAEVFMYEKNCTLLEYVEIELIEADIVMAKIYGKIIRTLGEHDV